MIRERRRKRERRGDERKGVVKKVLLGTIQPPVPDGREGYGRSVRRGLELVEGAARAGARVICLPEYFGVFGLPAGEWRERIRGGDEVLKQCLGLARECGVGILCPSLELHKRRLYNTTWVIGPDGRVVGRYRKVHLTLSEREDLGVSAGDEFPVFRMEGLTFGVMTCYDAYFPECARILALRGAEVIFWPSLQRAESEEVISLQARARALDNCVHVVRSSYGYPKGVAWSPGMMAGMSCVVDYEGRVTQSLGHAEGLLVAEISPGEVRPRRRSFEGAVESPRDYLFADRRPGLYRALCRRRANT